jgi:hypothetical protein
MNHTALMIPPKTARMPQFVVRICGVEVSNVTVRLVIGSGQHPVRHEIVFEDPMLGVLPLDDTLIIEIWKMRGPLSRQKWQTTDVRGLYAELILSGGLMLSGQAKARKQCIKFRFCPLFDHSTTQWPNNGTL